MARAPVGTGWGPAGDVGTIMVEPAAVAAAAHALAGVALRVERVGDAARRRAVAAYDALPPSDLHLAVGYCWGRWSQTLLDTGEAVAAVRSLTAEAAGVYADLDRPPR